jgi:hypothetical protein
MPNITRGDRMGGLLSYLAGPGRSNEHADPHLVAGDPAIMAWRDDAVLDRATALAIARQLDHPRRAFGVEVAGGSVWHCSLSLKASEGELTDTAWAAIAQDFVDAMDFTDASGRAPCRWVAVRHGASSAGNDHVHLAVGLVREDGTRASVWNDRPRAQRIAGELEVRYGLEVLESRQAGRGERGVKPAELAKAARSGAAEPVRVTLARTVRACAAAAADEAEFVRRTRRAGVLVRPRYAAGRDDVVVGYSVAQRPGRGERPVWYGGGHLARDLTLPRLRADWPDTPQHAGAAAAEWGAAGRGRRVVAPGREAAEVDPALWDRYTAEVGALREQLRSVPVEDAATWAHVAKETAGAFAAWSLQAEGARPGPLAATADALARSAHLRAHQVRGRRAPAPSAKGASLLLASLGHGGSGTVAQAALLVQLANTAKAVHDAHRAVGDAQRADQIASAVRGQLATVAAALPQPAVAGAPDPGPVRSGALPAREAGSVLPAEVRPAVARRVTARAAGPGRGPGVDR